MSVRVKQGVAGDLGACNFCEERVAKSLDKTKVVEVSSDRFAHQLRYCGPCARKLRDELIKIYGLHR